MRVTVRQYKLKAYAIKKWQSCLAVIYAVAFYLNPKLVHTEVVISALTALLTTYLITKRAVIAQNVLILRQR